MAHLKWDLSASLYQDLKERLSNKYRIYVFNEYDGIYKKRLLKSVKKH